MIKRLILLCAIMMTCCTSLFYAQDSVSISDFRYPETKAIDWKGGLNGYFNNNNSEYAQSYSFYDSFTPMNRSSNDASLSLNSSFLYFHSKDDNDHTVTAQFYGSMNSTADEEHGTRNLSEIIKHSKAFLWDYSIDARWSYLHYLSDNGFHFAGSIGGSFQRSLRELTRSYSSQGFDSISFDDHRSNRTYFNGNAGFGYGRMRDGTVVFYAIRIIERLKEDGLLIKDLSRDEMLKLVDRIIHRREYQVNYERYDKYFIQDIVEALAEIGAIAKESITPFAVLRMNETFNVETIQRRWFGWRMYYLFEDVHDQQVEDYVYGDSASHGWFNDWTWAHKFGIEYGIPLSLYTHIYSTASFEFPNQDYFRKFNIDVNITCTHELTEKIEILGQYSFHHNSNNMEQGADGSFTRSIFHSIKGGFVYFIEDHVRFNTVLGYSWDYYNRFADINSKDSQTSSFYRRIDFSFGLNYNIF